MKNHKTPDRLRKGSTVEVINTRHSGIQPGSIGVISCIEEEMGGYGVDFDKVSGLSAAGASVSSKATIFLAFDAVKLKEFTEIASSI